MSTRRGGVGDDAATVRPRPFSATRRFPSPNSLSLRKENTNPHCSNPNRKTLPRGRSSGPSGLSRSRPRPSIGRASAQKPTKPKPSYTASSGSSRSSIEVKKPSQDTATSNSKYPSRLHEKLAFPEGKVKRIASDIKKTKEMLDMNNPDASKVILSEVILSDIQDKISGIEKAIVHVVSDKEGHDENDNAIKDTILTKGSECEFPNQRRVYLSYPDSV